MYQKNRDDFEEMSICSHYQLHQQHEQPPLSVDPAHNIHPQSISHQKQHSHYLEGGFLYLDSHSSSTSSPLILSHPHFDSFYTSSDLLSSTTSLDPLSHPNSLSFSPSFVSNCGLNSNNILLPHQYIVNDSSPDYQPDFCVDNLFESCLSSQPYTDRFIGSNDDNSSFHSRSISSISSSDLGNLNGYHKQLLDSSQSHALHDKSPERLRSRSEGQIGAPHISAWPTQLPFHPNQTSTLKKKLKCKNYIDEKESGEKAIKLEQASTEEPPKFLAIFELPKHKLDATAPIMPIKLKDPGQEGVRSGNTGGRYRRIAPANRKCDYCGAQFTRKDRLKYHIESSHLRLEPGFKCEKLGCGRAFRQKSDLVRHLRHVHQQRDT